MHRQILSTRTHTYTHTRRHIHLENYCRQIQVTPISQPPTSRIHKGSVLWAITAPEVSLNASSSPPPPLCRGMAFVHFHPLLLFRCRVGGGRGHGEVILSPYYCPTTKWGPGECPQRQHSPTAIVAGFPNWNHLSAQVPKST